ncbi:MAG: class I SAM-dependent methyltransferase, partial [Alphaproteobacteria bacterium]|nr:class I SAM-dependent methyltransferase [Alphaproteobacteria bacterium]
RAYAALGLRDEAQAAEREAVVTADGAGGVHLPMIACFHEWLKPALYLEVGVATGRSLALARPPGVAIGIDPAPAITETMAAETRLFTMTSDAYFASQPTPPIDLAFIDGMHSFDQALRDFINIERLCRPESVILIHDCWPRDAQTATRERRTMFWTGDVWKLIPILRATRPDLFVRTLTTPPSGLGVVTRLDPSSTVLADHYDRLVAEHMDRPFADLDADREGLMAPVDDDFDQIRALMETA